MTDRAALFTISRFPWYRYVETQLRGKLTVSREPPHAYSSSVRRTQQSLYSRHFTHVTIGASGHTEQNTTIITNSFSARGEMWHCTAAIRAVLAVFIISAASGFVPTAYPAVGRPRSTSQCHRRLDRGGSSAPNGRRSLHMELSGEVLAAGLGERRDQSDAHSQCAILLPWQAGCMLCTRGYSFGFVQLQYRVASRFLTATTPKSIRMYSTLHSYRLRSKPDSGRSPITRMPMSATPPCNQYRATSFGSGLSCTSAQTQPKPQPVGWL